MTWTPYLGSRDRRQPMPSPHSVRQTRCTQIHQGNTSCFRYSPAQTWHGSSRRTVVARGLRLVYTTFVWIVADAVVSLATLLGDGLVRPCVVVPLDLSSLFVPPRDCQDRSPSDSKLHSVFIGVASHLAVARFPVSQRREPVCLLPSSVSRSPQIFAS